MHTHRRARPWLGTLVDIAILHPAQDTLDAGVVRAINIAFDAIAQVHRAMSYQDEASELSKLNYMPVGQWMPVSQPLMQVLAFSQRLSLLTAGIFDVCYSGADWRSLQLDVIAQRVYKDAALRVDLSGIAKGYAVDCAVVALQSLGTQGGWINAGGDVRVFGTAREPLCVRSGSTLGPGKDAARLHYCTQLHNRAAATSASYLLDAPVLRHGVSRLCVGGDASFTVCASDCMTADALTKVLAATGDVSHSVFAHYDAQPWIFN